MIIARRAIDGFVNRPLRDSAKAKEFPAEVIDRKLALLDPPPKFHTEPRLMQKVCYLLGRKRKRYLFFLDMGLGKSKCILDLFRTARDLVPGCRMLVLVPGASNVPQWGEQIREHQPSLAFQGVDGVGEGERMMQVRGQSNVVAITYQGLLSLMCDRVKAKRKKGNEWKLNKTKVKNLAKMFQFICFDESTAFKSHQSLPYRLCKWLSWSPSTEYAFALTGTPFGKDPGDMWAQFHVIDKGETLGETLGIFRGVFYTATPNFWGGMDYKFDSRKKKLLQRIIRHNSIRYEESECNDLPEKVYIKRPVIFPKETWVYYDRLITELNDARGNFKLLDNAFVRLRSLCSGFLTVKNPEGERHDIVFKDNPKIDDLILFLDEVPPDRKVVVFLEYKKSGELVCEALKKAKIKHVRLYSGTMKSERPVERFKADPTIRVLVSSSAGAYGGNWQIANYEYFFEPPVSPILRQQEEKRCHRIGQAHRTFIIDAYVKGSVEESILKALAHGKNLLEEIANGKKLKGRMQQ